MSLDTGYTHYHPLPELWISRDLVGAEPYRFLTLFLSYLVGPKEAAESSNGPRGDVKKPQREEKQPVPARAPSLACSGPGSGGGGASGSSRAPIPPAEPMATQLPILCLLLGIWGEYQVP